MYELNSNYKMLPESNSTNILVGYPVSITATRSV